MSKKKMNLSAKIQAYVRGRQIVSLKLNRFRAGPEPGNWTYEPEITLSNGVVIMFQVEETHSGTDYGVVPVIAVPARGERRLRIIDLIWAAIEAWPGETFRMADIYPQVLTARPEASVGAMRTAVRRQLIVPGVIEKAGRRGVDPLYRLTGVMKGGESID